MAFDHKKIEADAQAKWESLNLYEANLADDSKEPYYLLCEFPYPSGDLHIGHWYAFSVTDIYARMLRLRGKNVLFPIGFDAFGLPAENAAIKHGVDPKEWTYANMERMRGQLKSMGASFDWSKEVAACDPSYYHWTQWLFTKLFEHGLAERREASVKWCPKDMTVLANEQILDGACERCGSVVEEKRLTQWFLKITQYAERLIEGLDSLPWREEIKEAQRAWIGKSEGAYLDFALAGREEKIRVFTTRPDTLFGVTYVVLAPEHTLVTALLDTVSNKVEVESYIKATAAKTERERSENKDKTGVKLEGVTAINPASKEGVPVFIADYVLASYGTGAVMAVPAHDERDFAFAQKYTLPSREVVMPVLPDVSNPHQPGKEVVFRKATINVVYDPKKKKYLILKWKKQPWITYVTGGVEEGEDLIEAAKREIAEETGYTDVKFVRKLGGDAQAEFYAAHKGVNRVARNSMLYFELQSDQQVDIAQSEQEQHHVAWVTKSELLKTKIQHSEAQIILDRLFGDDGAYTGSGVLINSGAFDGRDSEEAKGDIVAAVGGEKATQYRLRDWSVSRQRYWGCPIPVVYDPEGKPHPVPAEHLPWLLPTDVDFKPTGAASPLASSSELKERVTKIFGEGWTPECDTLDTFVDSSWYFTRYLDPKNDHQFSDSALMKKWLPVNRYSGGSEHTTMHLLYARFFTKALHDLALVDFDEPFVERFNRGLILGPDGAKMSKSKGNVINPDDFVQKFGADAVRIYLAFIGPYNEPGSYPWNLDGVTSMRKFLDRIERVAERTVARETADALKHTLAVAANKISADGDRFKFNTAVSALMVALNEFESAETVSIDAMKTYLILLAPFAPHLAEHLWEKLGGEGSVHQQPWPELAIEAAAEVEVVVQVGGKKRGSVMLSPEASEEEALAAAQAVSTVAAALAGAAPRRVVYVPGKILNLVA